MDAIAESSGVSKATIYKHWRDKESLCFEAITYLHGLDKEMPVFDSGDLRMDIINQLRYQPGAERAGLRERIMPHIAGYLARNPIYSKEWRKRLLTPAMSAIGGIIRRGQERGQLRPDIDIDVAVSLIIGPMIFRNVFLAKLAECPESYAKGLETHVADAFMAVYGVSEGEIRRPRKARPH